MACTDDRIIVASDAINLPGFPVWSGTSTSVGRSGSAPALRTTPRDRI